MRRILPTALLLLAAACNDATLVQVVQLAPGGGGAGDGGSGTTERPNLDILIRMEADTTAFNPGDLMRVEVNGTDMTDDVVMGGLYALLRLDAAPILGVPQDVDLFKRTGGVKDSFTYTPMPYPGPTLTDVDPAQDMVGAVVRLTGTGFLAAAARVWFGGTEATAVTVVDDSTIDVTVPQGALPGLIYVQIGAEAAEGLVDFQPLSASGFPVPFFEGGPTLMAAFPSHGPIETAVQVYAYNVDIFAFSEFNGDLGARLFGAEVVTLPTVGPVLCGFVVPVPGTDAGAGGLRLNQAGFFTGELPFMVTE